MAAELHIPWQVTLILYTNYLRAIAWYEALLILTAIAAVALSGLYLTVVVLATIPRLPFNSEKTYTTSQANQAVSSPRPLSSWHSTWEKDHKAKGALTAKEDIEEAEVFMSVVIPAYNESERLESMLEEAVPYLDNEYGRPSESQALKKIANGVANSSSGNKTSDGPLRHRFKGNVAGQGKGGYEIILVNDGSKDNTVDLALQISAKHGLHDILRVVTLRENRGKGGAVTHGFRHVRGEYTVFADADGASTFGDLGKLLEGCKEVEDEFGRGIAVGSRAHMVGSDAVIKRSAVRNLLMHAFHLLLRLLTPPATSRIKDTQCGFKLFSRASLPHIIPYMHAEGWIFDVEMLMLAESAPSLVAGQGIRVAEVAVGWSEVGGSKLNVMWDSLGMAYGLAVLRCAWLLGIYKRR